jgi:hypothetical protein
MIGQCLSNTNESATIPILQKKFGTKQVLTLSISVLVCSMLEYVCTADISKLVNVKACWSVPFFLDWSACHHPLYGRKQGSLHHLQ